MTRGRYILGFHRYAERQIVVKAFDLMCWGICCGASEFAKVVPPPLATPSYYPWRHVDPTPSYYPW